MSFNTFARKVRNPKLTINHRRSALMSCILRLAWLRRERYLIVQSRYAKKYNLGSPNIPTEANLLDAIATIEVDRNIFLEKIRSFERKRIREKFRGRRQPKKIDIQVLYE